MNKKLINGYIEMGKPSILFLVLVTTVLGFYFAEGGIRHPLLLMWTLFGSEKAAKRGYRIATYLLLAVFAALMLVWVFAFF